VAALHVQLIEDYLRCDVWWPLISIWIISIELNRQDCSKTHVGTPPTEADSSNELKANTEVSVPHLSSRRLADGCVAHSNSPLRTPCAFERRRTF
jgi:hypothetical protein